MNDPTRASIMQNYDSEIAALIADRRRISEMDGLRLFLGSVRLYKDKSLLTLRPSRSSIGLSLAAGRL